MIRISTIRIVEYVVIGISGEPQFSSSHCKDLTVCDKSIMIPKETSEVVLNGTISIFCATGKSLSSWPVVSDTLYIRMLFLEMNPCCIRMLQTKNLVLVHKSFLPNMKI